MKTNKKTIKYHLQRQTLRLVGLAYSVSWLIIIARSIFQGLKNQSATLAGMASTSASQINFLLPSFLLPEEMAGQELLLARIKDEENLTAIEMAGSDISSVNLERRGTCAARSGNIQCRSMFPSYVTSIVPVGDGHRLFGHLIKTKAVEAGLLAKEFLPTVIILAIVLLLSLLGLFVMVTRLASDEIPAAIDALLIDVSKCLSNDFDTRPASFRFQEFQDLSDAVDRLIREARDGRKMSAIAQTTQMLAHDVRKPFSLLRMGMSMLGSAKDPESVKQVLARIVPEIDKAVRSVDGMIADVMEVGSPSTTLIQEAVSAESLIEATLGELIRMYPKSNISFAYDLKHVHMTNVHVQKVSRVFSNIVGNAFQAMRNKGSMWFKTVESNGMIQFCVGNSGTMIPAESLKNLFDAFFTSGKKGGTGLGLAIAQKVVTAHGGRIWCESSKTAEHPEGKVEFFFTLPVATSRTNHSTNILPDHSGDVAKLLALFTEQSEPSLSIDKGESALEEDILLSHAELGRPLRVLIIDDEGIYRAALASYLTRTPALEDALHLTLADGSQSALEAVTKVDFDAIITDVDMGRSSLDGFELVRELRRRGAKSLICVHSNRIVAADNKTAIDAGADSFLPKPMARAQFLRVLLQAAESTKIHLPRVEVADVNELPQRFAPSKPGVLIVDDSEIVLLGWESELAPDCGVFCMKSFEDLQERLASDPAFLSHLSYVVTDMHLDGSYGDGFDVGRHIKSIRSDLPVLLSSDDTFLDSDLVGAVDKVIAKMPVDLPRLTQWRTML